MVHMSLKPVFFFTVLISMSLPLQSSLATSVIPLVAKDQGEKQGRPALETAKNATPRQATGAR